MTPPINSVSPEEIAKAMDCDKWDADTWAVVNTVTENDDHMSTEQAIALGLILAARRAANTPVSRIVTEDDGVSEKHSWSTSPALPSQVVGDEPEERTLEAHCRGLMSKIYNRGHSGLEPDCPLCQAYIAADRLLSFATDAPLSEEVRIWDANQSCLTSPAAEPVAWVTSDILAAMKRGERAVPGWKRSDDFCIPLYAGYPAPSASREVTITDEMVERAMRAFYHDSAVLRPTNDDDKDDLRRWTNDMRAALLAALPERQG